MRITLIRSAFAKLSQSLSEFGDQWKQFELIWAIL